MPVRSRIKVLLAERNLKCARSGERPISMRGLSEATGITHSALVKLVNGKSSMISFETLDKLMQFFGVSDLDAVLEYVPPKERNEES